MISLSYTGSQNTGVELNSKRKDGWNFLWSAKDSANNNNDNNGFKLWYCVRKLDLGVVK